MSIVAIRNTNEKLTTGLDDDDDGYGNMSVITLRERRETGVACIANITGSLTPPIVRIRIDGFDRTDLFTISEESRIIGSDSNDGSGLYYGEMKLSYVNRKPNPGIPPEDDHLHRNPEGWKFHGCQNRVGSTARFLWASDLILIF